MSLQTTTISNKAIEYNKGLVLFTFLLGIFMGALDHGIVGPALSSILNTFNVAPTWGVWSFTIYTLTFAISIPILGKLSDRIGRKQTFVTGIVLFALGSLISAFAMNFTVFLIGRALQAIGSGGIFPITAAQIAVMYPPEKRGKALGLIGVAFGVGTILGPSIGGLIISLLDWQWIFLINIPISIIILLLISGFKQQQEVQKKPIDFIGIILLSITMLAIMLGITLKNGWLLLASIVLVILLVAIERKQADPVLNVKYFTRWNTLVLLFSSLLSGFVMATAINFLPSYAETLMGIAKGNSGLIVTPFAIASMVASLAAGFLVDKIGAKRVLLIGFIISLAGATVLAMSIEAIAVFILINIVMGFGVGIIIGAPLNVLILQAVEMKETGSAVGYLSLFRSIGSTVGATVAGLLLTLSNGYSLIYIVSAVLSLVSIGMLFYQQKK